MKKFKKIINAVIRFPVIGLMAFIAFFIPIKTEKIPFLPKIKEDYLVTWFPNWYFIVLREIYLWVNCAVIYNTTYLK